MPLLLSEIMNVRIFHFSGARSLQHVAASLRMRPVWVALVALVSLGSLAPSQAQSGAAARAPQAAQATPTQPARTSVAPRIPFEKYKLANGLEVILHQDRRLPIVTVNIWYHVGPANEAAGRTGFAHLFEHMMFQGSKHVADDEHLQLLESIGASDLNATTGFDRTNYFETVPSHQLEVPLWLESDRMGYLLDKLDQKNLSNQQDVVRNERRQRTENVPYGLAEEELFQTLFPKGHPYYGVIIGSHADIQAARLDDVRAFFRQYYAPNNATLVIAGDFETARAKQLVQKYFATLKRGAAVPPARAVTPPITSERRKVVTARVELPKVYMAWLTPPIYKPGDAEADITATLLGGGQSSRLYKKLVYERRIAQSVQASQQSLSLQSVFTIEATASPGHTADELEKAIAEELTALATKAPDGSEVERARNTIETSIIGSLESVSGLADRLNTYNQFVGTPDYIQTDIRRYSSVTPSVVQAFVRDRLKTTSRVVLHAVPGEPRPLPPEPPKGAEATSAQGGDPINADEPWRSTQPKPAAPRPLQLPTPVSATLANGLTLILSERHDVPIVASSLVIRTGGDANPLDKPGLASFTASMLDQGTATRNALQIADEVARLGADLGGSSDADSSSVYARSLASNFPATLDLLADVVLHPAFPAEEVERLRGRRLAGLLQQRDDPSSIANKTMLAALYGTNHPYGFDNSGTEASVKAMTRDDLAAFWKQHFVPNNAALVVAGDITMPQLQALADKAFGGWARGTVTGAVVPPSAPGGRGPGQTRVIIVDKPGSPQTQVRVATVGAARSSPDFRPAQVMNLALGGLFGSRINMNLREAHGYTYGARSQFVFRKMPGPFLISSGVRTDVTAPAVSEMFNELRGMIDKPLSDTELKNAKEGLAQSLPGAFETSSDAVGNFANVFVYNLGLDYYTHYGEQVAAVTNAQTLEMARKYLVPSSMVVVAVGDRATIEPELRKLNLGPVEIRDADGKTVATN
jgi:zinc protease